MLFRTPVRHRPGVVDVTDPLLATVPDDDDALVLAARAGDDLALAALITRYRGFARAKSRPYFLVGADREDVVQEGLIGLYKAIRDYDSEQESSFRAFAELCITRQLISAVKGATRHKHGPLNSYVSFSRPVVTDTDDERVLADVLPAGLHDDPAERLVSAERIRALQAHVSTVLSDLEVEVLRLYVDGKSYVEIAALTERHTKAVDNALQRVKRKLEQHLRERELAEVG